MRQTRDLPEYSPIMFRLPWVVGVIFILFNSWYNHNFYHVNSFKLLYMAGMLLLCFTMYDAGIASYRWYTRQRIDKFHFPWHMTVLYLLPVIATFPGALLHAGEAVGYNFKYELATRLIVLAWIIYLNRFVVHDTDIRRFLFLVGISGMVVLVLAIIERAGITSALTLTGDGRIRVTYGNPNYLAGALVPMLPFLFSLMIPLSKRELLIDTANVSVFQARKTHLYFVVFAAVLVTLSIMVASRAALGAAGLGCSVVLILLLHSFINPSKKKSISATYIVGIFACIGIAALLFVIQSDTLRSASRIFQVLALSDWADRLVPWQAAWNAFKNAPIFGYGLGSSYALFFQYVSPLSRNLFDLRSYNHAHSEWLEYLTEGGIFGYIFFFILWGYVVVRLIRIYKMSSNLFHRRLIIGILAGTGSFFFHGIFSVAQRMVVTQIPFYTLLGIAFILIRQYSFANLKLLPALQQRWQQAARRVPLLLRNQVPPLVLFVLIGVLYLPWANTQYNFVEISNKRSINNQQEFLQAIQDLQQVTSYRQDVYALATLFRWQQNAGLLEDALYTGEIIERTMPNYRTTRFQRAFILLQLGNFEDGVPLLKQYIESDNYYFPALATYNQLVVAQNNFDEFFTNLARVASFRNWHTQFRELYSFNFSLSANSDPIQIGYTPQDYRFDLSVSTTYLLNTLFPSIQNVTQNISQEDRNILSQQIAQDFFFELMTAAYNSNLIVLQPTNTSTNAQAAINTLRENLMQLDAPQEDIEPYTQFVDQWEEGDIQKTHSALQVFARNFRTLLSQS